jgi:hypothetical protein
MLSTFTYKKSIFSFLFNDNPLKYKSQNWLPKPVFNNMVYISVFVLLGSTFHIPDEIKTLTLLVSLSHHPP